MSYSRTSASLYYCSREAHVFALLPLAKKFRVTSVQVSLVGGVGSFLEGGNCIFCLFVW